MAELGTITIGGLDVPRIVGFGMTEQEEEIGGYNFRRMHGGTLRSQEHWSKFRVSVSADGLYADGLDGLDRGATLTFRSQSPRSIRQTSAAITVPAARRTDGAYAPRAYTWRNGVRTATTIASTVGNVITVTTDAGCDYYEVEYFRELSIVLTERPQRQLDSTGHRMRWSFVGEQV